MDKIRKKTSGRVESHPFRKFQSFVLREYKKLFMIGSAFFFLIYLIIIISLGVHRGNNVPYNALLYVSFFIISLVGSAMLVVVYTHQYSPISLIIESELPSRELLKKLVETNNCVILDKSSRSPLERLNYWLEPDLEQLKIKNGELRILNSRYGNYQPYLHYFSWDSSGNVMNIRCPRNILQQIRNVLKSEYSDLKYATRYWVIIKGV